MIDGKADMTNQDFRDLFHMLDAHLKATAGTAVGFSSMHAGAMIMFSRHVRKQLEQWEIEVARRAKAEAESARMLERCVRDDFGADAYDKLDPDHAHGLHFGDTMKG